MTSSTAQELYDQQNYPEAVAAYRGVLEEQPADSIAWKNLGLSLVLTSQIEEGVIACQKAADLQPGNSDVRYGLGYALGAAKRFDKAIDEFDAALFLNPQNSQAKQGLLYSLVQHGNSLAESEDPRMAEPFLSRAHKLAPQSPNAIVPLLQLYITTLQPMKAVKLVSDMPANLRSEPSIGPLIEKLEADPDFSVHMKQVKIAAPSAHSTSGSSSAGGVSAPAAPQHQAIIYVGCPNCKQQISAMAFVCPHCNFKIKESGTFAGRDTGPAYCWQDVALTIMSIILILSVVIDAFRAFQLPEMVRGFVLTFQAGLLYLYVGCLLRWELPMTIAKYLLYLPLLYFGFLCMLSLMVGAWLVALLLLLATSAVGFMVYLLNWASD